MKFLASIVIAHRLATIINADKIVVMEKGKIVEQGTHEELLLKDKGFYKHLYSSQFLTEQEISVESSEDDFL